MTTRDIVVIGASAGGVPAVLELAGGLPAGLPAALFVAVHSSPDSPGLLPEMISRAGALPAAHAVNGEAFAQGRIYVAPPDRHLLLNDGQVEVTRGPHEHGFRPAVDPLFRTAARSHGPRVVGIVLSGGLNDGTHGLQVIKSHGGVAIAQHIDDAIVANMPLNAIRGAEVDHVLPVSEMPALIARLARQSVPKRGRQKAARSRDVAERGTPGLHLAHPRGPLSPFTCPECGGALWETAEGKLVRFACHVGHSFTAESLMAGQDDGIEAALWSALRALEEKAALRRRMAERVRIGRLTALAVGYEEHAEESEHDARIIRSVLTKTDRRPLPAPGPRAVRRGARRRPSAKRTR